jgi:hypothetical protein
MKNFYTLLLFLFSAVSILAQAPEKMSYQAVLRDASNTLLTNQEVGMQISILQGTITGTAVYTETQTATTNINGLVSIEIGSGTSSDDFSAIDWSAGPYFIKTATDPSGGSSYTIAGTSQIMSVPFAMYAKTAGSSLMPTMTNAERLAISDPATAFMVYVTDFDGGTVMLYDGSKWKELSLIQLRTLPDAPTSVTATATYGEATVSFTAPSSDGGSAITSYTATSSPGDITETLNQAGSGAITVTGLTNSVEYSFTVTATNAIGTSAASGASNSVKPDITVGDFRAGGVVFWVDPTDNMHGLVCAIEDQSAGIRWWNGSYTTIGATGTAIGTGSANTTAIIASQGAVETNYAAGLARAYSGGGFSDWFLPSKDALNEMHQNRATINSTATANGGSPFVNNGYWSSSEYDINFAWFVNFHNVNINDYDKKVTYPVRAVRAF